MPARIDQIVLPGTELEVKPLADRKSPIVLRIATDGEARFTDHLAATARTVLGALDASEVPFDRVLHALQPRRDPGSHPLFQSLFSIQPPAPAFATAPHS